MVIDIIFLLLMVMAIFKGFRKGLVLGIFSFLIFMIGLAAALKLSAVVASHFSKDAGSLTKWMPLLAFILVFIVVALLVSLGARLIKKALQLAMLGWIDSLGGIILYVCIYTIIFSVFLFYGEKLMVIKPDTIASSKVYPYVAPWGPKVIENIGKIIPFFKNIFSDLEGFFASMAKKG